MTIRPNGSGPLPEHPRAHRRDLAVQAAVKDGLLDPDRAPLAAFLDLAGIRAAARELHRAWPAELPVLHAFAAKANSMVPVLRLLREQGLGCEVASPGELDRALAAGFDPAGIVLDSPVKTRAELARALGLGIAVNIDNFQELERVDALRPDRPGGSGQGGSRLGVRINPQVGTGSIEAMSTAGRSTKFGIPLTDPGSRERLLAAYADRPWLRWVHVHVGSQGCPLELTAAGVAAAVAFAQEVDRNRPGQIEGIDVGGGLAVDFDGDADRAGFDDHVAALRAAAPALFDGRYRIVTEFGRALLAKNGFLASRVEYTKTAGGRPIALTHAGAQVATRTVFAPAAWPLRVLAYDRDGRPSTAAPAVQDVAGPCCFAGDLLARGRELPLLAEGDLVVVPDTGAYYFSTHFDYNSLPEPPVHAFEVAADGSVDFTPLRPAGHCATLEA
ncbi:diaminopimelate decarboxylase [Streptacidiphilus cavernicola]|uniref:Diaminopimelate decarboxylase n=1 Tax=Streptacidiphilus cavernicola TaxID=3342716 RepID=A0ABV6VR29_9ACTN